MAEDLDNDAGEDTPVDLITPAEATNYLPKVNGRKISARSVYRWVENGTLPHWKLGRLIFVRRSDVLKLIRAGGARRSPRLRGAPCQTREHKEAMDYLRSQGIV